MTRPSSWIGLVSPGWLVLKIVDEHVLRQSTTMDTRLSEDRPGRRPRARGPGDLGYRREVTPPLASKVPAQGLAPHLARCGPKLSRSRTVDWAKATLSTLCGPTICPRRGDPARDVSQVRCGQGGDDPGCSRTVKDSDESGHQPEKPLWSPRLLSCERNWPD